MTDPVVVERLRSAILAAYDAHAFPGRVAAAGPWRLVSDDPDDRRFEREVALVGDDGTFDVRRFRVYVDRGGDPPEAELTSGSGVDETLEALDRALVDMMDDVAGEPLRDAA